MRKTSRRHLCTPFALLALLLILTLGGPNSSYAHCRAEVRESLPDHLLVDFYSDVPEMGQELVMGEWFDAVRISGCESIDEPGKPDVPFFAFLVAIPHKQAPQVVLDFVEAEESYGFRLRPCTRAVKVEMDDEVVIERRFELDEGAYSTDAYYPSSVVRAEYFGVIRGQPLARIMVFPFRFNPVVGSVEVVRRATFSMQLLNEGMSDQADPAGVVCAETGPSVAMHRMVSSCVINPQDVIRLSPEVEDHHAESAPVPLLEGPSTFKMAVSADGICKVTGSALAKAGASIATIDVDRISIRHLGEDVAVLVEDGEDGSFDGSDYLLFLGQASHSLFTKESIYWLMLDRNDAPRMQRIDAHSTGGASTAQHFVRTTRLEEDKVYWQNIPDSVGEDHWFWTMTTAPDATTFPFEVHNRSEQSYDISIEVQMWGKTNTVEDPDHHTRVLLNETVVDDQTWNGSVKFLHDFTCSQSLLDAGANELKIEYVGDTGAIVDTVYTNYIELTYLATFVATQGVLEFEYQEPGRTEFSVTGLPSDQILVFDVTDPYAVRFLENTLIQQDGDTFSVKFEDDTTSGRRYLVSDSSALKTKFTLVQETTSSLKSRANRADYVIISHTDFVSACEGIADHNRAHGVSVLVADLQDVYDEFNYGEKDPQAIKDFVDYAYHNFAAPPPSDVLLVGDASIDYRNNMKVSSVDLLPTHLYQSAREDGIGETPSDNWYVCVDGGDVLPDMNIGRICARDAADVDVVLAKLQAYDNGQASGDWLNRVLFVADSISESLNSGLDVGYVPTEYSSTHVNANDYSSGNEAREAIIASVNEGCFLVNYAGHGSVDRWAQDMLKGSQVSSLTNGDKMPFLITLTCLNGFFPSWERPCMAELFLSLAGNGAIGCWSPTSVDEPSNHKILAEEFFEAIFYDFNCYMGASTTAAKVRAFARAGYGRYFDEIVETFTLFGDPGLALAVPTAPSEPRITVQTDQDVYYGGSTINVDVLLENSGQATQVDAYLALDADGMLLFFPAWNPTPTPVRVDVPSYLRLRLRATSLAVPTPSPAGYYCFYAALTQPGDMSQIIGAVSAAPFDVQ